eukprot:1159601-Pelagomonas_calceolata.AAC.4
MGREPLDFPASDKIHPWLSWRAQGTPRPGIWTTLPNITARQPYQAVSVGLNHPKNLVGIPSFGGFQCSGQSSRDHFYAWQLREAGQLPPSKPPEQLQLTQTLSAYFVDALAGSGAWKWPVTGTLRSICGTFQLAN